MKFGKVEARPASPSSCLRNCLLMLVMILPMLSACSNLGDPRDPAEGFNRAVFAFNEGLDSVVMKPLAQGYEQAVPGLVQTGVGNFFENLNDLYTGVNNLLQGKPQQALEDTCRVLINSTFGIFGLFDIASDMGLPKHDEDFGQTLGRWGVGDGPFVMLPLLGPRNLRDTGGLIVDTRASPLREVDHVRTHNSLVFLRLIDKRAELLPADKVIEEAALDKYSYIRDAYLQHRRSLVYDGDPPREKLDY